MRKLFILSLLAMMIAIGGCGGGGTSADPLGTDSITFADAAGTGAVSTNGALTLKATVKNAAGAAVAGREVSFGFVANASGATLASAGTNTNGAGEATILYRAGATAGYDVVRAYLSNGAYMDVSIAVGGGGGGATTYTVSISASTTPVKAGQVSIITATVTGGSTAAAGVAVNFTLPVNSSGATLSAATATTDGSGKAVVTYQPGITSPTVDVQDTVQAAVGAATSAVALTRTGSASTTYAVSISPSPASVTAGQVSIITATVTSGSTTAAGVAVGFTLPINSSGATLSAATATTDGNGKAIVIYQPGITSPTLSMQDTIQAAVGTATSAVAITRTGAATTTPYAVSIAASTGATPVTAGQVSIITATVTGGSTVAGVSVSFTLPVNSSGATLSPATATTDGSGKAVVVYEPGTTSPTLSMQDTVQAAVGTATGAVAITRAGSSTSAFSITITASPVTLGATGSNSVITANVKNNAGTAVSGVEVIFDQTVGTSVLPALVTTDGSGNAVAVFTAPVGGVIGATAGVVTASITPVIDGPVYTVAVVITY